MSLKFDANLAELFEIPFLHLDATLVVLGVNAPFAALFGDVSGRPVGELSDDFNERKFTRRIAAGQPYSFRIPGARETRSQYTVRLKPLDDQFVGFVNDSSDVAKAEAMLASYSQLIEKQNREIKAKTEQINIWRTRIQNELDQAATVQDLLVPGQILTPHIDSRCAPVQELSGDFHDLVIHDDGRITFISGDVAGKGIYAAIMLAQTLTAFRANAASSSLTGLVSSVVEMLENRFPDGLFVALTLVRLAADKKSAEVLNLGNPDVLLLGDDGVEEAVASVGPAIGFLPAEIYSDLQVTHCCLENRRLFVFTDGLTDIVADIAANAGSPENGDADIVAFIGGGGDVRDRAVLDRLMANVGNIKRSDDVTVACFSPTPLFEPR